MEEIAVFGNHCPGAYEEAKDISKQLNENIGGFHGAMYPNPEKTAAGGWKNNPAFYVRDVDPCLGCDAWEGRNKLSQTNPAHCLMVAIAGHALRVVDEFDHEVISQAENIIFHDGGISTLRHRCMLGSHSFAFNPYEIHPLNSICTAHIILLLSCSSAKGGAVNTDGFISKLMNGGAWCVIGYNYEVTVEASRVFSKELVRRLITHRHEGIRNAATMASHYMEKRKGTNRSTGFAQSLAIIASDFKPIALALRQNGSSIPVYNLPFSGLLYDKAEKTLGSL